MYEPKSPGVAAVLNLLLPGIGYLYTGSGLAVAVTLLIGWPTMLLSGGLAALLVVPLTALHGYFAAVEANQRNMASCPSCKELVQKGARVCKHCRKSLVLTL